MESFFFRTRTQVKASTTSASRPSPVYSCEKRRLPDPIKDSSFVWNARYPILIYHWFIELIVTTKIFLSLPLFNRIGGVMVSMFASSVIDSEFGHRSGQTNNNEIGICCFSAKHTVLKKKCKLLVDLYQDIMSEWTDISIRVLLFQWASTMKIKISMLI